MRQTPPDPRPVIALRHGATQRSAPDLARAGTVTEFTMLSYWLGEDSPVYCRVCVPSFSYRGLVGRCGFGVG